MEKGISQKLKWQVILFLARRLPPCKVLLPLASESRERRLTIREKITLKLHLFTCEACRRYVRQIERMSEIVKPKTDEETIHVESSDRLSDDARTRIKAALEAAAQK
jgi:predicted anti-sigma-YlaC factor YlaD